MRVLFYGGRDFHDQHKAFKCLDKIHNKIGITCIIQGEARGADTIGKRWAELNNIPHEDYPANWASYGRRAGYIRNKQMRDDGKPDLGIECPGGVGTKMMNNLLTEKSIPILTLEDIIKTDF